jgi:hypothetical protein
MEDSSSSGTDDASHLKPNELDATGVSHCHRRRIQSSQRRISACSRATWWAASGKTRSL